MIKRMTFLILLLIPHWNQGLKLLEAGEVTEGAEEEGTKVGIGTNKLIILEIEEIEIIIMEKIIIIRSAMKKMDLTLEVMATIVIIKIVTTIFKRRDIIPIS